MGTKQGIYRISNLKNGKFYIGSTVDSISRFSAHRKDLERNEHCNPHLQSAWNLYGEGVFRIEMVEEMPNATKQEVQAREQALIDEHYDGGDKCYNVSRIANRPDSELNKKKVMQLDKDTREVIKIWDSTADAERGFAEFVHGIRNCCRGRVITAGGFRWKYADPILASRFVEREISNYRKNKRYVGKIHPITKELMEVYPTIEQAAKENGINSYIQVLRVCSGHRRHTTGKMFCYLEEERYMNFLNEQNLKESEPKGNMEIPKETEENNPYVCKVCGIAAPKNNSRSLSTHIQYSHKGLTSEQYTIKYLFGGVRPVCVVEGCGSSTRYTSFSFVKFCANHSMLASIEGGKIGGKATKKKPDVMEEIYLSDLENLASITPPETDGNTEGLISGSTDPLDYGTTNPLSYKGRRLTPRFLSELTKEEREPIAEGLFSWFRKGGFPYPLYRDAELLEDWKGLKDLDVLNPSFIAREELTKGFGTSMKFVSNKRTDGNLLVQHFNGKAFYTAREKKNVSMVQAFGEDETLRKVIRNRLGITYKEVFNIHGAMLRQGFRSAGVCSLTSTFNPSLAKYVYEKYSPEIDGKVFDFSMGFGHRMLGALSCTKKQLQYVACDPWNSVIQGGMEMARFLGEEGRVKLICKGAEEFDPTSVCPEGFDVIFSSPPYYNKEIYDAGNSSQSIHGRSYRQWLDEWWVRVVKNSVNALRTEGSVFVLNMAEYIKIGNTDLSILNDMLEICRTCGLEEVERFGYLLSKSHFGKRETDTEEIMKFEPVVVMKKKRT